MHPPRALRAALVVLASLTVVTVLAPAPGLAAAAEASLTSEAASAAAGPAWLQRVNSVRTDAGLDPVTANAAWTAGIRKHLVYLRKTDPRLMTGRYANAHTENPKSPYYTRAGAKAGGTSNLAFGSGSDLDATDGWLRAPFHAIGVLRPGLRQIAFARDRRSGYAGQDVISGLDSGASRPAAPILFPGDGATFDLTTFGGESPDPIETCRDQHPGVRWSRPSLPLIALLPSAPERGLVASLTGPGGAADTSDQGDLCLITADTFVSSDRVYGPTGRSILRGDHAVLVVARTPLRAGTYTVMLDQPTEPDVTWSFTSAP